ncbi:TPA: hypothetical protein ACK3RK_006088 [Burkholderia cepacia]
MDDQQAAAAAANGATATTATASVTQNGAADATQNTAASLSTSVSTSAAPAGMPPALSTALPADDLAALGQLLDGLKNLPAVQGSESHSLRQVLIAGFTVAIDRIKSLTDRVETLERLTID